MVRVAESAIVILDVSKKYESALTWLGNSMMSSHTPEPMLDNVTLTGASGVARNMDDCWAQHERYTTIAACTNNGVTVDAVV